MATSRPENMSLVFQKNRYVTQDAAVHSLRPAKQTHALKSLEIKSVAQ